MASKISKQLLADLISDVETILRYAETTLLTCNPTVLLEKPAANKWNVLDCLEDLNRYSRFYLPRHEQGMAKSKHQPSANFKSGYFGELFTKMMKPLEDGSIPNSMNAMKKFDPVKTGEHNTDILNEFIAHQKTMLQQLERASNANLAAIRITSSLGPILRLKLGDSFRFLIAHEQRHLQQVKNTLQIVTANAVAL